MLCQRCMDCSYMNFMNCKSLLWETEGQSARLKRWFEKIEQTLGLANANQIPWSNVKAMMTTEYCPATEIEKMEQELWTLRRIGKYIRGFPEGIKGNMISSKPATLHEAINMARALVEQSVQGNMSGLCCIAPAGKDLCWKFTKGAIDCNLIHHGTCPKDTKGQLSKSKETSRNADLVLEVMCVKARGGEKKAGILDPLHVSRPDEKKAYDIRMSRFPKASPVVSSPYRLSPFRNVRIVEPAQKNFKR
ncbi:hypothetical protein Tco_0584465 [Tanacetum coccineum]